RMSNGPTDLPVINSRADGREMGPRFTCKTKNRPPVRVHRTRIRLSTTLQAESARPYNAIQGIDVLGQGATEGNHAILLKSRPDDYRATANMEAGDLRSCLAAGNCMIAGFDSLRGTPYFQWDIRAGKRIGFHERAALE